MPSARNIETVRKDEMPEDFGHHTRRCSVCSAWLCRWNPGAACWCHGDVEDEAPPVADEGRCSGCGVTITQPRRGRRRKWCSNHCRKRMYDAATGKRLARSRVFA